MARLVQEKPNEYSENFLWLAVIQEGSTEPLSVDAFHYTGMFSKRLAEHIGWFLLACGLLTSRGE